jgi:hypothetical protein
MLSRAYNYLAILFLKAGKLNAHHPIQAQDQLTEEREPPNEHSKDARNAVFSPRLSAARDLPCAQPLRLRNVAPRGRPLPRTELIEPSVGLRPHSRLSQQPSGKVPAA